MNYWSVFWSVCKLFSLWVILQNDYCLLVYCGKWIMSLILNHSHHLPLRISSPISFFLYWHTVNKDLMIGAIQESHTHILAFSRSWDTWTALYVKSKLKTTGWVLIFDSLTIAKTAIVHLTNKMQNSTVTCKICLQKRFIMFLWCSQILQ